jgi:hypothetical protein
MELEANRESLLLGDIYRSKSAFEVGSISREHQDKSSGALEHVKRHYTKNKHGIHQVVHAALRRSIGDAYAAVVSQVGESCSCDILQYSAPDPR